MTEARTLMASLFPERSAKPAPVAGGGLSALLVDLHVTALPPAHHPRQVQGRPLRAR